MDTFWTPPTDEQDEDPVQGLWRLENDARRQREAATVAP